jgi:hypothetical protein
MGENEVGDINSVQPKKSNTVKILLGALVLVILIGLGVWRTCTLSSLDVANPYIVCLRDYYSTIASDYTNAKMYWADGVIKITGEINGIVSGTFEFFPYDNTDFSDTNVIAAKKILYSITVMEGSRNASYLNEAYLKDTNGTVKILSIVNLHKGQAIGKK